ncbi:hypothetical protein [Polynucleobacter necessarius]|uniref:hypothetical protein n=1 Tax=Polynucleobacter necessarius TaxID=576610 RepID=UPI000E098118|nr:hypothetical protein [Polynucleobacter necessarius]HAT39243.1 hypothetical protein [Polynucleobacter sp.]
MLSPAIYADPPVQAFYAAVLKMARAGKLGQVIKQESIATSITGAQAWKIAYISSDISGRKTISTGNHLRVVFHDLVLREVIKGLS